MQITRETNEKNLNINKMSSIALPELYEIKRKRQKLSYVKTAQTHTKAQPVYWIPRKLTTREN